MSPSWHHVDENITICVHRHHTLEKSCPHSIQNLADNSLNVLTWVPHVCTQISEMRWRGSELTRRPLLTKNKKRWRYWWMTKQKVVFNSGKTKNDFLLYAVLKWWVTQYQSIPHTTTQQIYKFFIIIVYLQHVSHVHSTNMKDKCAIEAIPSQTT
jgi:hypothetical protein